MLRTTALRAGPCGLLAASRPLLKKSGKPTESPPAYKQAYLPYEKAPTKAELDRERRRFSTCASYVTGKPIPVGDVPENMYTYGKEGFAMPGLTLFKDQPDPVVGPEHSYPGIFENKAACRHMPMDKLFEAEHNDNFASEWDRQRLENKVGRNIRHAQGRMGLLMQREYIPFTKERSAKKVKPVATKGKGGDPDKKPAAAKK